MAKKKDQDKPESQDQFNITIGDNASNIAVGKNVRQDIEITETAPESPTKDPTAEAFDEIFETLEELSAKVDSPPDSKTVKKSDVTDKDIYTNRKLKSESAKKAGTISAAKLDKDLIFISYARLDGNEVEKIYLFLKQSGYNPWMDVYDIIAGEQWERSIARAIKKSVIFIACLSSNSARRRGVIQKEIQLALDKYEGLLPEDIFIIPLRLDECSIPERLAHLHVEDWFDEDAPERLLKAISTGINRRNA